MGNTTTATSTGANKGLPDTKLERFQRNLRVALNEKEITERAQRAAHLLNDRDQKEESAKAASKHAKAQIAEVEAELRRVSSEIRDGATYKEVSCERLYNFRVGSIQEIRTDTHQEIAVRAMTDRERQLDLGLDKIGNGKAKAANGAGKAANGEAAEQFYDDDEGTLDSGLAASELEGLDEDDEGAEPDDDDDDGNDGPPGSDDDYEPALATQKPAKKKRAARALKKK